MDRRSFILAATAAALMLGKAHSDTPPLEAYTSKGTWWKSPAAVKVRVLLVGGGGNDAN